MFLHNRNSQIFRYDGGVVLVYLSSNLFVEENEKRCSSVFWEKSASTCLNYLGQQWIQASSDMPSFSTQKFWDFCPECSISQLSRQGVYLVSWQDMVNVRRAQRQAVTPLVLELQAVLLSILLYTELLSSSTLHDWYLIRSNACFRKC